VISLVRQQAEGDCGVAAIATLLSRTHTYDDVRAVVAQVDPHRKGMLGLRVREVRQVLERLGLAVEPVRRRWELDTDAGVLLVYGRHTARGGHYLAAKYGLLWDPCNGFATPWRDYQTEHRRNDVRFGTLLRVA
jgi:hypothetical protein